MCFTDNNTSLVVSSKTSPTHGRARFVHVIFNPLVAANSASVLGPYFLAINNRRACWLFFLSFPIKRHREAPTHQWLAALKAKNSKSCQSKSLSAIVCVCMLRFKIDFHPMRCMHFTHSSRIRCLHSAPFALFLSFIYILQTFIFNIQTKLLIRKRAPLSLVACIC